MGRFWDSVTLSPARRRRWMRLRLRADPVEAYRLGGVAARHPGRSRRRHGRTVLVVGAIAAGVGGAVVLMQPEPLGQPPNVPTGAGSYAFSMTQPGTTEPVAYDPCKPVRYIVNDALEPPGAEGLVDDAVREISAATGLVFENAGTTDEPPSHDFRSRDIVRYGMRTPPVLIAWAMPEQVPELEGWYAGLGGSSATGSAELRYVSGAITLNAPTLAQMLQRPGGEAHVRAVILHELGHLVGLDHVDDPDELMYWDNNGRTTLGPGDREGLAALGSGRCFGREHFLDGLW